MKTFRRPLIAFSILCGFAMGAAAAPADDLKALIEKGQAAEAYELGRQHPDQLGDPSFDFYFGVAAIGAGRAGEGVLALERFVVTAPDNLNGRLELARGYFVLGEDTRAREEFEFVLNANPPPEVQANVQRFLDAIRAREFLYRPTAGFYIEAGLGYDTNVNAGVSGDTITRWGLVFQLPATGVRQSDSFATLGAGFNWSRPVRPGMYVFASGGFDGRYHDTQSIVDQEALRADGGLTWIRERDLWRLTAGFSTLRLQSDRFRDVWSLTGEWHRQLDELRSFNLFGQYADLSYTGANSLRDSGFTTLGVGYRQAFVSAMQPLLNATLYAGREDVRSSVRSDLSRDLVGARVAGSLTPAPKWSLVGGVTYQTSRFDGGAPPPVVGLPAEPTRKDDYTAVDVGLSYAIDRNWSVKGELLLSRNSSNDSLSGFKRDVLGVKVRYDFR
ncbi:MAG: hypothetical protein HYX43_14770 [Burkholderiales bacterium]|nr:hypothetical protein [Burkholderiales bacterium]